MLITSTWEMTQDKNIVSKSFCLKPISQFTIYQVLLNIERENRQETYKTSDQTVIQIVDPDRER